MSRYREIFEKMYSGCKDKDYASETTYLFMLNAPEEYEKEKEMTVFMEGNPDASLREVFDYFNQITPDGLSPADDGTDLIG